MPRNATPKKATSKKVPKKKELDSDELKLKFKELTLEFDGTIELDGGGKTTDAKSTPVCPRTLYAGWVDVDGEAGKLSGKLYNVYQVLGSNLGDLLKIPK